jgi:nucleoside-diphosphate-sugar epimerase
MRVVLTGGSGFLGSHAIPLLVAQGHSVAALARSDSAADRVRQLGAEPVVGDLDDAASVSRGFEEARAGALVNIASLGFGHAPVIVGAAEGAGIRRAIFVSTTAIATKLNAQSKTVRLAAEATIHASGLDWTILRPTMIYGTPADRNMARLLRLLRRSPVVPVPGRGDTLQQPVHVADAAAAVVAALGSDVTIKRTYDIAGPEPLTFRQIIETAAAAVDRTPRIVRLPLGIAIAATRQYEKRVARPRLRAEQLERLAEDKAFDISPARLDLGYTPRSFAQGMAEEARLL